MSLAKIPSERKSCLVLSGETFWDAEYNRGIGVFGVQNSSRRHWRVARPLSHPTNEGGIPRPITFSPVTTG